MPKHDLPYAMETVKFPIKMSGMNSENGRVFGYGETVGNGIEGWAPGAIFVDTDASAGANLWRNDGTSTTASWTAVGAEQFLDNEKLYFGTGTTDDAFIYWDGTNWIFDTSAAAHLNIGGVGGLAVDDAAISGFAAATDTAGQDMYIETQDAGATPTTAKAGGSLSLKTGDGAAAANAVACGQGGSVTLTSGAGGANTGGATGQTGGSGGATSIVGGAGGATNSTGAHAGGAGGQVILTGGAGGAASAGTGNGGAGGAFLAVAGAAGTSTGGTGGAGGYFTVTCSAGGASTTGAGGAGADVTLTASAGGAATGGTGDGGDGGSVVLTPGAGGATTGGTAGAAGAVECGGLVAFYAPAAQTATDTATLTAAQITGPILVGTPTAAAAYTLPTGTALSTALEIANDRGFDFTVINVATGAAFDITMTTNTGWTLVGNMVVESNDADRARSSATFRARKTAANTWTLYRLA